MVNVQPTGLHAVAVTRKTTQHSSIALEGGTVQQGVHPPQGGQRSSGKEDHPAASHSTKAVCSTYIQLLCMNSSSIFCTLFNMFEIRIKLMC